MDGKIWTGYVGNHSSKDQYGLHVTENMTLRKYCTMTVIPPLKDTKEGTAQ